MKDLPVTPKRANQWFTAARVLVQSGQDFNPKRHTPPLEKKEGNILHVHFSLPKGDRDEDDAA